MLLIVSTTGEYWSIAERRGTLSGFMRVLFKNEQDELLFFFVFCVPLHPIFHQNRILRMLMIFKAEYTNFKRRRIPPKPRDRGT